MSNINLPDDYYIARPTAWGYTKSRNGYEQFAIEFSIRFDDGGSIEMTHFIGIQNEKGQEIMEKSCRTCGWTGSDFGAIELDVNADVRLKIEKDGEYGSKIKFIDPVDGARGGGLIARQRMQASEQASLVAKLNARAKTRPAAAPSAAAPARPATAATNARPAPSQNTRPASNARPAPAAAPKSDWFPGGEGDADGGPDGSDTIPF